VLTISGHIPKPEQGNPDQGADRHRLGGEGRGLGPFPSERGKAMNRALLAACLSCGFVTRRHSHIGAEGRCPNCRRPLTEITLTEARHLALERRTASRLSDRAAEPE
jgi:hypothetical protein